MDIRCRALSKKSLRIIRTQFYISEKICGQTCQQFKGFHFVSSLYVQMNLMGSASVSPVARQNQIFTRGIKSRAHLPGPSNCNYQINWCHQCEGHQSSSCDLTNAKKKPFNSSHVIHFSSAVSLQFFTVSALVSWVSIIHSSSLRYSTDFLYCAVYPPCWFCRWAFTQVEQIRRTPLGWIEFVAYIL